MKKLFFAALIALAGFTACGTKNVETAATEATEQREVGGGDIAYVQVEAVLAQSDLYNAEGIALKDKTEKAQKSWAQKEQNFQYEVAQLQEKYQKGLITTNDAQSTQENIERRIASYQAAAQKEAKALDEENFVFSNRAQDLLHRAIENLNADGRYKLIVNANALLDADSTLDITPAVLQEVNRHYHIENKQRQGQEIEERSAHPGSVPRQKSNGFVSESLLFFVILPLINERDYMLLVPLLGAATHFPVEEQI